MSSIHCFQSRIGFKLLATFVCIFYEHKMKAENSLYIRENDRSNNKKQLQRPSHTVVNEVFSPSVK